MYSDFIGKKVNIVISSRGDTLLEYVGIVETEDEKTITLSNADISYLMLNFQKGIFGNNMNVYRKELDKVIINKKYIISCNEE